MKKYHQLLAHVLEKGTTRSDRTGTGTLSVFGTQTRYHLSPFFPIVTTKKIHFKSVVHELLWFLRGDTNIKYLKDNGVRIWDEWADQDGNLGPVYGQQWRSWPMPDGSTHDQIAAVVDSIRSNPASRRHLVTAWNPSQLPEMALPPCHLMFQFYVHDPETPWASLSCHLYQRSADLFLGVPFNISSYALLTCMIAQACSLRPGELIHTIGDAHIYLNHLKQVNLQLERKHLPLPALQLNPAVKSLDDFTHQDITFSEDHPYRHHPTIPAPVAV